MPSKYWIKLYHEILDDPKMGQLSDCLFRRTIEFFLVAGDHDMDGLLPDVQDMSWRLRVSVEDLTKNLQDLAKINTVHENKKGWFVTQFTERQAPVSGTERTKRHRSRKRKSQYYGNDTVTKDVTNRHTDTDTDTDKEAEKDTAIKDSRPDGRPRRSSVKDKKRKTIAEYFSSKTGLDVPNPKTAAQKKSAGKMWYAPIREICDLVDWNIIKAKGVIDMTLDRLDGMTIANPNSIIKTSRAIIAEEKIGKGTVRQKEPHEMTDAEFSSYLKDNP